MSIVNFEIVKEVISSSQVSVDKDEVTSVASIQLKDGRSFSLIAEHKFKDRTTETMKRFIGLPSDVDVTVKYLVQWEAPVVVMSVIKVYYGGEVAAITTTHVDQ